MKCPYTFPHRDRYGKMQYLLGFGEFRDGKWYPFVYNVKFSGSFDFDEIWKEYGFEEELKAYGLPIRKFQKVAERAFAEMQDPQGGHFDPFDEAICSAQRGILEEDDHAYHSLWDGTEYDVGYFFAGRSGGNLVVGRYDHGAFSFENADDFEDWLEGLNWEELKLLYKCARHWDHDFTPAQATHNILYEAGFQLFEFALQKFQKQYGVAA